MLRPAFITATLSIALVINIVFLTQMNKPAAKNTGSQNGKPASLESFAKAYNLDTGSLYE